MNDIMHALLGGVCIGLAASYVLMSLGQVAGISAMLDSLLSRDGYTSSNWRLGFLVGLCIAGIAWSSVWPSRFAAPFERGDLALIMAGLLVGFGTRLGNGCTSGHGICGLARFSRRSLVAVCVFMSSGILSASLYAWVVQS